MKTPIVSFSAWLCSAMLRRAAICFLTSAMISALAIGFVGEVQGAAVQGVTINAVSSEFVALPDFRRATALVSPSGFYGDYLTVSPRGTVWLTSPTTAGAYTNAFVTFDLGSVQPIQTMKVWNYNESGTNTQRGVQQASISVAGNDLIFTNIIPSQTFTRAPGLFTNTIAQSIDLGGVSARYVRINVITNFGAGIENRVGLSKVRFINTNTPPTVKLVTRNLTGDRVTVQFSEPVSVTSATNAANYSVLNGTNIIPIVTAAMDTFNDRVVLQTGILNSNITYTLTAQNVFEASGSITITNTTVTIAPEFVLWLKADAGVTADGGGLVSQWTDQSGAGNNAGEPNTSAEPTLVAGALNGNPVLRFNGLNTGLFCPHTPSLIAEGDISFFVVVTPRSFTNFQGLISKCGTPASNTNFPATFDFELATSTGKPRLLRGNGSVATTLNGNSNAVIGTTYIVEMVVKGTNAMSYLNGFTNGNAVFADGIEDNGNVVRIGRREDNSLWLNGDIAEIILLRGALSDTERQATDDYLARKYKILTPTVGAPVLNSQPTNFLGYVGFGATFSAAVSSNGASPKTLQWYQAPGTPLSGQTTSTLTLSNLTLGQDNTSYYLTVSNVDGVVTSSNATLSVLPVTAPFFTLQPQAQSAYIHQAVTFTALALGSPQLTYQWNFNGTPIIGATTNSLTVANLSTANAGNFTVTVTDNLGSTNSNPAALTVLVPPTNTFPAAVLSANPLLYYQFSDVNSTTNTTNYGSLGAAWNGQYQGTYSGVSGPVPPTFPSFDPANLAFDNETLSAGGVAFPAITLNNTNGGAHFTMAAWVYKDFNQVPFCGVIYERDSSPCGFGVNTTSDQFDYTWNNGQFGFNSGLLVPSSVWCFMAVVIEPTKATMYLQDGTSMRTATNTAAHAAHPVWGPGYVGWDPLVTATLRRWIGSIDEPMVFDRALSASEINSLYAGTAVTPVSTATLSITGTNGNLTITWPRGSGTLQRAVNLTGPYADMMGITSPYNFAAGATNYFYRLRVQ